jgi:hypothetical protein
MKNQQNLNNIMQLYKELKNVSGEKDTYEMEIELEGMTLRCDIKDLDRLMIKLQSIGTALEGGK